jgi:hypothetical protein
MHQLVQEIAREIVSQPPLRARYEATVGLLLAALAPDDIRQSPDALTPHVAAAIRSAERASANPLVTSRKGSTGARPRRSRRTRMSFSRS